MGSETTLSSRLREARKARALGQAELALKIKARFAGARVTQQNLASLEKGRNKSSRYIAQIASVLEVNTDWLALGVGDRDRSQALQVSDPKTVAVVKLMQQLPEYQKDQVVKIIDTIAKPPERAAENG